MLKHSQKVSMAKNFDWHKHFVEKYQQDPLNIKANKETKFAVIGDIHEQVDLYFMLIQELLQIPNLIPVSLGDIWDKGKGPEYGNDIWGHFSSLIEDRRAFYVNGNHELKKIRKKDDKIPFADLSERPNCLSFIYQNGFRLTCLHAGVTPNHTWKDLKYNNEICYVRSIDTVENKMIKLIWIEEDGKKVLKAEKNGALWHDLYDGRLGFIASGHDQQKDGVYKLYKNSINLDTGAYDTGVLTAGIFGNNGFEKVIQARR